MTEESKATEAQITETTVNRTSDIACLPPVAAPEYWESILTSISDGFWVLDREWRCTYINEPQAKMLGMPKHEILGKNIWDLFAGIIDTEIYIQLHRAIAEQKSVHFEHHRPRQAGWLESRAYPFADGVSVLTIDITERKRAEQALEERSNFMELLAQMSPGLLYLYDVVEQRNIYINARSRDFLGYPPETVLAMGREFMAQVMHPDDLAIMAVHLQRLNACADGSYLDIEYRMRHINGEWRWFSSRDTVFSRTAEGGIHQILGTAEDITERKRTEAALRDNEERFRKIFEASPLGVSLIDINGKFLQANQAYCEMLGYSEQELCQLTFADITHPEDVEADVNCAQQIFKGEISSYQIEKRYITKNGEIIWVHLNATAIFDQQGQLNYCFAMVENISERQATLRDREQTEDALRERERRFSTLFNGMEDWVLVYHLTPDYQPGKLIEVNEQAYKKLGYSREELLTMSVADIIGSPAINPKAHVEKLLAEKRIIVESVHTTKDGRHLCVEVSATLFTLNGLPTVQSICRDITERKRAQEALRESEEHLRLALKAARMVAWTWNRSTDAIERSQTACDVLGIPPQMLTQRGEERWNLVYPEDLPFYQAKVEQAIASLGSYTSEFRIIRPDNGETIWVEERGQVICDQQGQFIGLKGVLFNISDRKRLELAQQLLAQASAVLVSSLDYQKTLANIARLIIPTLADYCFIDIVATDGKIQRVASQQRNPDKQAWFSQVQNYLPPQDLETHPVIAAIKSGKSIFVPEVTDEWMQAAAQSPEHLKFIQSCKLYSLMTVPFIARGRTLGTLTLCTTSESGRYYQYADLVLAEELAYRAALALDNAQLYQQAQEANRIKDEFLAVLSHELRSPLNPILGWTNLLQTGRLDQQKTEQALETIERNARLQTQLIEDLLDISRILQGKIVLNVGVVNLATMIEAALETVRLAAEAKNLQIQIILDADVGQVLGDTVRLQQVIWNFLSNAVKFTPSGGEVEIRLAKVGNQAEIQVRDTGKGIAPQFLPYVFDCFRQEDGTTTRQFGGLGLGLAIARHLTELHGGTVQAESAGEGMGATFKLRLPLTTNDPPPTQNHERLFEPCDLSQLRILVVDDEADIRTLLAMILEQYGAEVKVAASAVEAFIILERYQANLLISDIGMPNMDGYALMRQIRMLPPEQQMPAIALTAYAGEYDQRQAIIAGFHLHIAKPVAPQDLVRAIAQVISETNTATFKSSGHTS
ncbi:hypothetical protein BV372_03960 [Nostoc sp. T09]|uniref:PAS domain S-box protein n=1 Tax=Nostoc sp. T09 TaxID=1932621 RepID=UPI000A3734AE|nr:PAS domain S-box protein [Nostoc sp. T09]OUL37111.1 hypothetical protein BV372_03960 [Nostoc sp. T09]